MEDPHSLADWIRTAPAGTAVPVESLKELLEESPEASRPPGAPPDEPARPVPWREKLWTVPPETRLGTEELAEALGRSKSWVYRHTSRRSGLPLLPHRKLDGGLVFVVREIRKWIRAHEEIMEPADGATIRLVTEE